MPTRGFTDRASGERPGRRLAPIARKRRWGSATPSGQSLSRNQLHRETKAQYPRPLPRPAATAEHFRKTHCEGVLRRADGHAFEAAGALNRVNLDELVDRKGGGACLGAFFAINASAFISADAGRAQP